VFRMSSRYFETVVLFVLMYAAACAIAKGRQSSPAASCLIAPSSVGLFRVSDEVHCFLLAHLADLEYIAAHQRLCHLPTPACE
jgi:hypothetical protein